MTDCMSAIELNYRNMKAYIRYLSSLSVLLQHQRADQQYSAFQFVLSRAAKACNALNRWQEAIEFCKGGLQVQSPSPHLPTHLPTH